ncbi:MAG TPA: helix-turn-helix domain-containing protein, partial [Caulobacteraceae bacterium]
RHPALWRALTLASRHDEMRLLDQVVRLGRQTAVERVASFFLEIYERLRVVGLAEAGAFTMPLTQEAMADALGLSPVHVNRTLQQLRRDGLAELSGARVTLHQPGALSRLCGFEEAARAYAEAV